MDWLVHWHREEERRRRKEGDFLGRKFKTRVWNIPGGVSHSSLSGGHIAVAGDDIEFRSLLHGRVLKTLPLGRPHWACSGLLLLPDSQGNDVIIATMANRSHSEGVVERREWGTSRIVWRKEAVWGEMVALPLLPGLPPRIAAAASDFSVIVADSMTGVELLAFSGHSCRVTAVFSVGDGTVLSGSDDGSIKWWSGEDGTQLQERDHGEEVICLAVSPCRSKVAVGTDDRDVMLYHFPEWTTLFVVCRAHGGDSAVFSVAFSPDGRFVASGGNDSRVNLICAERGTILMGFSLHRDIVSAVAFSSGGTKLLSSSRDQTIRVLNLFARWEGKVRAFFGSVESRGVHRDALAEVARGLKRHYVLDLDLVKR